MLGADRSGQAPWLGALERAHYRVDEGVVLEAVSRALRELPFYRARGYPSEVRSMEALRRLPVLERETLRAARPSELLPEDMPPAPALRDGRVSRLGTSGAVGRVSVFETPADGALMPALHPLLLEMSSASLRVGVLTSPICSGNACDLEGSEGLVILPPTRNVFAEPQRYFERVLERLTAFELLLLCNPIVLAEVVRAAEAWGGAWGLSRRDPELVSAPPHPPACLARGPARGRRRGAIRRVGARGLHRRQLLLARRLACLVRAHVRRGAR